MLLTKEDKRIQNENSIFPIKKIGICPISKKELDDLIINTAIKIKVPKDLKNPFCMGSQFNHYDFIYAALMKILIAGQESELYKDNVFNIGKKLPSVYADLNEPHPVNYEYGMINEDHEIDLEDIKGSTGFIEIAPDTYIFSFLACDRLGGGEITLNILYFDGKRLVLYTPEYGNSVNRLFKCAAGEESSTIITDEIAEGIMLLSGIQIKEPGRPMTFNEYQQLYSCFLEAYQKKNNIDKYECLNITDALKSVKDRIQIHRKWKD